MPSTIGVLILLAEVLVVIGLPILLAVLIGNALRLRDMRPKIGFVLFTVMLGFAPFLHRMIVLDNIVYQVKGGTKLISADRVQDGVDLDSKQPVEERSVTDRQVLLDGDDVVLATDKSIKVLQRRAFRPSNWQSALKYGIDLAGGTNLIYEARPLGGETTITSETMGRLVAAVMKRVNPGGANEVVVRQVGSDRIEVIVPGADPATVEAVKNNITRLGSLEFMIICNENDHGSGMQKSTFNIIEAGRSNPEDKVVRDPSDGTIVARWLPVAPHVNAEGIETPNTEDFRLDDRSIAVRQRSDKPAGYYEVLVLQLPEDERVTGQFLRNPHPTIDSTDGSPAVAFGFTTEGGHRFGDLTGNNKSTPGVRRRLAVVLDNQIHNAPGIESRITTSGQIHGGFTQAQVEELVNVLNAGALPVELLKTPVSEFSISPTLGEDVKNKGMRSLWVSALVVVIFMAVYYRYAGIVADIAMLLNLLFIAAAMALVDAAFTLPGLAGLVLGAGMAVDANVLIYERLREEQQRGASLRMAIHNGFDKAMGAIIDSNLTSIITAIILYFIGTEQVKGFAVSLLIGLVVNLYTAVWLSRVILTVMERGRLVKSLPMMQAIGETRIDFLALGWPTTVASIIFIVVGLGAFVARGSNNYDIDFSGGTMVTMLFKEDVETDEVRNSLAQVKELGGDITLERLTLPGDVVTGTTGRRFRLRTINQDQDAVEQALSDTFADKLIRQTLTVGEVTPIPPLEKATEGAPAKKRSANEIAYAGGHSVVLDVASSDGKTATSADRDKSDIAPSTLARYLDEQMKAAGIAAPDTVYTLEGLAGKGLTASENQVKLYHQFRLLVSPTVSRTSLDKILKSARDTINQKPVFDEVTSFASSVAGETKMRAVAAILLSLVAIIVYIWFRFETVVFGIAAVVALAHDVLVALGCMALGSYLALTPVGPLLLLTDFKINMAVVAAFLTIVGYSINDTIVIFDRLREIRGKAPVITRDMINLAVNQCLGRSILTALTVFLTVLILYVLGGEGIHGFAFVMLMGVIAGSYSTIFIANPIVLWLVQRFSQSPAPAARFSKPAGMTTT